MMRIALGAAAERAARAPFVLAAALLFGLVGALPAAALVAEHAEPNDQPHPAHPDASGWVIPAGAAPLPVGLAGRADQAAQAALAISRSMHSDSVRVLGGSSSGYLSMEVVAARRFDGAACFTFVTTRGGTREFACPDARSALVRFFAFGGPREDKPTWGTLVGVARSDGGSRLVGRRCS